MSKWRATLPKQERQMEDEAVFVFGFRTPNGRQECDGAIDAQLATDIMNRLLSKGAYQHPCDLKINALRRAQERMTYRSPGWLVCQQEIEALDKELRDAGR